MELCLPPACGSPQQFVQWRMVKTSESPAVGRNELGNNSSDLQNPEGFCSPFAQKSQISASMALEGRQKQELSSGWAGGGGHCSCPRGLLFPCSSVQQV